MERDEYQRLFATADKLWWFRGRWAALKKMLQQIRPDAGSTPSLILDAGCGPGANLRRLTEFGHVVGIDIFRQALDYSREKFQGKLVQGSVLALPFRNDCFDVVVSSDVLYHQWITDDVAALRE